MTFLSRTMSISLGIIFLLAAFSKIEDLEWFHKSLQSIAFVPLWLDGIALFFIPGLEFTLGVYLIFLPKDREATFVAVVLLAFFLALSIYMNLTTKYAVCGCIKLAMPIWFKISGWEFVVRDSLILLLALFVFASNGRTQEPT